MLQGSSAADSSTQKEYHDDSREHPDEGFMVKDSHITASPVDQQQQQQQPKANIKHKRTVSWDINDPKSTMTHDLSPKSVLSDNKKLPPVKPALLPPTHPNGLSHPLTSNTNNSNQEKKEIEMSNHHTHKNSSQKETTPTTSKPTHTRKLTVDDLFSADPYSANLISPAAEADAHIMRALGKQTHHHRNDSPWNMEVSVQTAGSKDSEMTAHTYDSPRKMKTPDEQPTPKPASTDNDNDDGSLALSSCSTSQSHPTVTTHHRHPTLTELIPISGHPTPALGDEAEATLIRVLDKREQDRRDEVETAGVATSSPAATMEEMIRPQLSLINELSLPQPPMPPSRPPRGRMAASGHTNNGSAQTNYLERLTLSKRQLTGTSLSSISTNKTQLTRHPSNEGEESRSIHNDPSPTAARRPSLHQTPSPPVLPPLHSTPSTRDIFVANAGLIYRRRGSHVSSTVTDDDIESQKQKRPSVIAEGDADDDDDDDEDDEEKQMPRKNNDIFRSSFQRNKKRTGGRYKRGLYWLTKYNAEVLQEVMIPKMKRVKQYVKYVFFVIFVPLLTAASLLFYVFGNPKPFDTSGSYSWWLIFAMRQVCTLTLSKASEIVFIDVCSLRTRICTVLWGPMITLMIAQARGWPYVLTLWALWDFAILYGKGPFAAHWGYWQDWVAMFNASNPAGEVLYHELYRRVLISAIAIGSLTAIKRVVIGMWMGQRTYKNYGRELEKLKRKIDTLKEVAQLAYEIDENLSDSIIRRTFENATSSRLIPNQLTASSGSNLDDDYDERSERSESDESNAAGDENVEMEYMQEKLGLAAVKSKSQRTMNTIVTDKVEEIHANDGNMVSSDRLKIQSLIGEWEEPYIRHTGIEHIAIENVLEFYNVLSYMSHHYPFSFAFGPADTRDACVASAEKVYSTLLRFTPEEGNLPFETLSLVALDKSGNIIDSKIRSLTKLFRPRRSKANRHERRLIVTLIDFIKACDYVYKKLRLFRAAVANASQIDRALEKIVNVAFFFVLGIILLGIFKINAMAILVSVSGLIVSFAFMFGNSASKYFDGLLFILVRRPFDIGDRIAVSGVQENTSPDGSSGWIVEEVSLFTTTVRFGTTNEVATYANGSLANSRIINMRRSPKACVKILMKFGLDTHYEKIQVFRSAVISFVKERPNEWISLDGFRATRVEADLGFIEYAIVLTHFESWQNIAAILQSKSQLNCYCLEVAKKLEMRYVAPPLPVNLELKGQQQQVQQQSMDGETMTAVMAKTAAPVLMTPESIDLSQFSKINDFFKGNIKK